MERSDEQRLDEQGPVDNSLRRRKRALISVGVLLAVGLGAAAAWAISRDSDDSTTTVAQPSDGGAETPADEGTGHVRVQIEEIDGFFTEGFEVGLRFETAEGDLISSTLWTDFVQATGNTDLQAFYDSVLTQAVPAGPVRVSAEANVGAGPPPSIPDLAGELPCSVSFEVDPGEEVTVEVNFSGTDDCLVVLDS